MSSASEALVAGLLVIGALFVLLGAIGLARLPDFLTRLHAPTKATTLGVGSLLLASAIHFSDLAGGRISLHELAVACFLFVTAPVSAHLLAKAALHRQAPTMSSGTPGGAGREAGEGPSTSAPPASASRAGRLADDDVART